MFSFKDPAAMGRARLRRLLRDKLLPSLPGRIARIGHALVRRSDLRTLSQRDDPVILLASNDLSRSGAPFLLLEMARLLREDGHALVVASPVDGPLGQEFRALGVQVLIDHKLNLGPAWLLSLGARTHAAICNTVDTAGVAIALASSTPVLWYLHEVRLLKDRLSDDTVRRAVRDVSLIWAGSHICAEQLEAVRQDVQVVPYGVEPLCEPPQQPASSPMRVSVFGSLEPRKGQDLAVQAYAQLTPEQRSSISLTFYGRVLDREFADGVLATAKHHGVEYGGELDRTGYRKAVLASDAVLVPSREDTLPLVSLDALAAGRMLLLTADVGTLAWLTPGVDSLAADATSVDAVAALLRSALARTPDAAAIGAAARRTHQAHFSPAAFHARLRAAHAFLTKPAI